MNLRLSTIEKAEVREAAHRTRETSAGYTARVVLMVVRGELDDGADPAEIRELHAWHTFHRPAPARRTAVEVIYDLLGAMLTSPGELEQQSGYSETQVRNALRELTQTGRVRRVRHGVWERAA